jgi:hypothetical protein
MIESIFVLIGLFVLVMAILNVGGRGLSNIYTQSVLQISVGNKKIAVQVQSNKSILGVELLTRSLSEIQEKKRIILDCFAKGENYVFNYYDAQITLICPLNMPPEYE